MPYSIRLDEAVGLVVVVYTGRVDVEQIRNAYADVAAMPGFRAGLKAIADARQADPDLSGDDIRSLATLTRSVVPIWGETRWLAIVSSDLAFGLGRMFMSLTDHCSISTLVVRTIDDADDWLGLGMSAQAALDLVGGA